MSTELRLSLFTSDASVRELREQLAFDRFAPVPSLHLEAAHGDVSAALSRVLAVLGDRLGARYLIKVQIHERARGPLPRSTAIAEHERHGRK